jgi:hypothetical protein
MSRQIVTLWLELVQGSHPTMEDLALRAYGDLKTNPSWDPLRKDPRFNILLAKLAPRDCEADPSFGQGAVAALS